MKTYTQEEIMAFRRKVRPVMWFILGAFFSACAFGILFIYSMR